MDPAGCWITTILNPFKKIDYLFGFTGCLIKINFYHDRKLITVARYMIMYQLIFSLRNLFLYLYPFDDRDRELGRIIFADGIYFLFGNPTFNLVSLSFLSMVVIYREILFKLIRRNALIMRDVFVRPGLLPAAGRPYIDDPGTVAWVQKFTLQLFNSVQTFVLVIQFGCLFETHLFYRKFWNSLNDFNGDGDGDDDDERQQQPHPEQHPHPHPQQQSWFWIVIQMISIELNILCFNLDLFLKVHLCNLIFALAIAYTALHFEKLKQIIRPWTMDHSPHPQHAPAAPMAPRTKGTSRTKPGTSRTIRTNNNRIHLNQFMVDHTQWFLDVMSFDRAYSKSFVMFLLAAFPINLYICAFIMVTPMDPSLTPMLLGMVLFSLGGAFLVHYIFALYPKKIHCNKGLWMLINVSAASGGASRRRRILAWRSGGQFRFLLKVDHYLWKFHCRKRYGITYAGIGLITIQTYIKYMMLYGKFLILSYKIMRIGS